MKYYTLNFVNYPWGDYGQILNVGMSKFYPRLNGNIQYARTGPMVPPVIISSLGDCIVNNKIKVHLGNQGFCNLGWRDVVLKKVVQIEWEKWDMALPLPPICPVGGEPENYILSGRHNKKLASDMGPLFEIVPQRIGKLVTRENDSVIIRDQSSAMDVIGYSGNIGMFVLYSKRISESLIFHGNGHVSSDSIDVIFA